jgi:GNAT superfamily N-acetyltransferase
MLTCRPATHDDAPAIHALGDEMRATLGFKSIDMEATREHCDKLFHAVIDGAGFLGVVELDGVIVGFLGACPVQAWWSPKVSYAQEFAFWVSSKSRKLGAATLLLDAVESWAKGRGLSSVLMTSEGQYMTIILKKFYRAHGYKTLMTTFAKELHG